LYAALRRLLRPLCRLLLRQGVPFAALEEIAKQVYVDVAMKEFGLPGKRPTAARVSVLSGLTRKEVQRLLADDGQSLELQLQYNRAVRVLGGWVRDADFLDAQRQPLPLPLEGDGASFAQLVRRYSGDMPMRAVLDELLHAGSVAERPDGRLMPVARAHVPRHDDAAKLAILGGDVADLIATIDHNLQHGATDPRYQRKVLYNAIPARDLPAFRKLSADKAQQMLEALDRWLARRDAAQPDLEDDPALPRSRVGLGIYYIEEPLARTEDAPGDAA
jgi:hypothetical protein